MATSELNAEKHRSRKPDDAHAQNTGHKTIEPKFVVKEF
jgi:hypothetical protein